MSNKISITAKAEDGVKRTVNFDLEDNKDGFLYITISDEKEAQGIVEMTMDDFNNFCLDLFILQKKITANQQS